jgi:hypothetical protein
MVQVGVSTTATVVASGASTWLSNGYASAAKPVAVMSRPLWLSGRRRQAISPQPTKVPAASM